MFVQSMTVEQLHEEFRRDVDEIVARLEYRAHKWYRASLKQKIFPFVFCVSEHTRSGNEYIVRVRFQARGSAKYNRGGFSLCFFGIMNDEVGKTLIDDTSYYIGSKALTKEGLIPSPIHIYKAHLFSRYRERYGAKEGYRDIHEQYLLDNTYMAASACTFDGNHGEKYDVLGIIDKGVVLGVCEDFGAVTFKTFLTTEMLNRKQMEYVQKMAELHNNATDLGYFKQKTKVKEIYR